MFDFAFPQQFSLNDARPDQIAAARGRMDVVYLVSYEYLGKSFSRKVDGGKRIFEEYSTRGLNRKENDEFPEISVR